MDAPDTPLQGQDMPVIDRLYTFELGEKNGRLSLGDGVRGPSRCTVTAGERRKHEKAFGGLVVSSGHTAKNFDAIEEAFDQIACAVQRTVVVSFRLVVRARGNNGLCARGPNLIHNHNDVGIVALIRDDSPRAQMIDQFCGTRDIGNLPFSDHHAQRTTGFIRGQPRLGAQPSAGATERLRSVFLGRPPSAGALSRWSSRSDVLDFRFARYRMHDALPDALRRHREKLMYTGVFRRQTRTADQQRRLDEPAIVGSFRPPGRLPFQADWIRSSSIHRRSAICESSRSCAQKQDVSTFHVNIL